MENGGPTFDRDPDINISNIDNGVPPLDVKNKPQELSSQQQVQKRGVIDRVRGLFHRGDKDKSYPQLTQEIANRRNLTQDQLSELDKRQLDLNDAEAAASLMEQRNLQQPIKKMEPPVPSSSNGAARESDYDKNNLNNLKPRNSTKETDDEIARNLQPIENKEPTLEQKLNRNLTQEQIDMKVMDTQADRYNNGAISEINTIRNKAIRPDIPPISTRETNMRSIDGSLAKVATQPSVDQNAGSWVTEKTDILDPNTLDKKLDTYEEEDDRPELRVLPQANKIEFSAKNGAKVEAVQETNNQADPNSFEARFTDRFKGSMRIDNQDYDLSLVIADPTKDLPESRVFNDKEVARARLKLQDKETGKLFYYFLTEDSNWFVSMGNTSKDQNTTIVEADSDVAANAFSVYSLFLTEKQILNQRSQPLNSAGVAA